jgi:coenzyme PQQ precursor peptide PqqA
VKQIYLILIARITIYRVPVGANAVLARRACAHPAEEARMQWQTPKLVEIACGCEINAYFPADL